MFENHLVKYNWKYMAGDSLTASDFHLYCFYTQLTLNKVSKYPKLSDALQQNLRDFPKLNEYLERMRLNLKDYMSIRPEYFFWDSPYLDKLRAIKLWSISNFLFQFKLK